MPSASTARAAALGGLAVVLVGAAVWWAPFLARSLPVITSTPSPGPSTSRVDVVLRPGSQACVAPVPLDPRTEQIQFIVSTRRASTARLAMDARAPGYARGATVTQPTTARPKPARARIEPPARDVVAAVCVRNRGDTAVSLLGTNQAPAIGIAQTSVEGRSLGQSQGVALTLLEARNRSVLARLGTVMQRASDFTDGLMPIWLVWPLVVLLVIGTPFAVFGAFWLALRDPA